MADRLRIDGGVIDLGRNTVERGAERVRLTPNEAQLIAHLAAAPEVDVPAEVLCRAVWGRHDEACANVLQQTVSRLRRKLDADPALPPVLITVSGGYRLVLRRPEAALDVRPRGASALPEPATGFVGRAAQLAAVDDAFRDGVRLVTVTGPGGVGKTRVALRHAGSPDPVGWGAVEVAFVDCADARSVVEMAGAAARALGVPLPPDGSRLDSVGRVADSLRARGAVLLVLDNVEHLLPAGATVVERWLARAPDARLLVTSLARTGLAAERVVPVPPLPAEEALELYAARTRAAAGGRDVLEADLGAAAELVKALDGIPLALELAAARTRTLSTRGVLDRIARSMGQEAATPRAGDAARPDRHVSLDAVVAWSWSLLSPAERSLLACCSLFRGGFTLEAAEAAAPPAGPRSTPVASVLEGLVNWSLVRTVPGLGSGAVRFRLYATVAGFARHRLAASPDAAAATRRFVAHLVTWGREEAERARRGADALAPERLLRERENLEAAFETAEDPDDVLRLAGVLDVLYSLSGPFERHLDLLEAAEARGAQGHPGLRARVMGARATALRERGRAREAVEVAARALVVTESVPESPVAAELLIGLAGAHLALSDAWEAGRRLDEARARLRRLREPRLTALLEANAGALHRRLRAWEEAEAAFRVAIAAARRAADRRLEGRIVGHLALLRAHQRRWTDAADENQREVRWAEALGDPRWRANALANQGRAEWEAGRLAPAEARLVDALAAHRQVGNATSEAVTLGNLGLLRLERGDAAGAEARIGDAIALHREAGDARHEAMAWFNLATVRRFQGRRDDAAKCARLALERAAALGDAMVEGHALALLGALAADTGDVASASEHFGEAGARIPGSTYLELCRAHLVLARERAMPSWGRGVASPGRDRVRELVSRWEDPEAPGERDCDVRLAVALLRRALDAPRAGGTATDPPRQGRADSR